MRREKQMIAVLCIVVASASLTMAAIEDDEKECADQLTNLASCIPFVSGTSKNPTPQCCQDTQKLKASKPKCLCVLIKESTDPSMGLPVNTTLALQMPAACNIDATVSNCPALLNLQPDSPDAKIFKQASQGSSTTSTIDSNSPTSASASTSSGSTSSSSSPDSSSKSDSKPTTSSNDGAKFMLLGKASLFMMASYALIFI